MLSSGHGLFPFGRVCFATSWVDFRSVECVLSHPGSMPGRQNVSCHVPCLFLVGKVGSAASQVNFWSSECVPPCFGSISSRQSVFRHVLVNFRSAECVPPCPGLIFSRQSSSGPLESVLIKNIKLRAHYILLHKICGHTDRHTHGKKM